MKVLSVNVGRAVPLQAGDRVVPSAIRKTPVGGPVRVETDHLEGDESADRRVHGGPLKAVYAYPAEHYGPWRAELGVATLPMGSFGENLTLEGLLEATTRIGDVLAIGSAELAVTRARLPCFKLEAHFGRNDLAERMLANGRSGFYLTVRRRGTLAAGDEVRIILSDPSAPSVLDDFRRRAHAA